jgi:hypothetical protein
VTVAGVGLLPGIFHGDQEAIRAHDSPAAEAHGRDPAYAASEANQVILHYSQLSSTEQQDILDFLRSL